MTGTDGQDHRPVADDGPSGRVGRHGGHTRPRRRRPAPRARIAHRGLEDEPTEVAPMSLGQRLRQPRTILSIVVPLGDHRLLPVPQSRPPGRGAGAHPPGKPGAGPAGVRGVLPRLPVARLSLEAAAARDRLRHQPAQLGRDHVHLVVRQLRRAGQARRRLSRLPAQDEQRRRRSAGRSAPCSSSASSTSSRSPSSAWRPGSGASATGCRRRSGCVFVVGHRRRVVAAIGLFTMRNFGRRILARLPLPPRILELYERFEEGVFGAIGLQAPADPGDPDRVDLDDRRAAPVHRHPGARLRRRRASACRGRSSWR